MLTLVAKKDISHQLLHHGYDEKPRKERTQKNPFYQQTRKLDESIQMVQCLQACECF